MRVPEKGLGHYALDKPRRSLMIWGLVAGAVLLSIIVLIIGSYYWSQSRDNGSSPTQSMVTNATFVQGDQPVLFPTDIVQPELTSTLDTATGEVSTPLTPTLEITSTPQATYTPWPTSTLVPTEINQ